MYLIKARNVNDAFSLGLTLLTQHGVQEESRAGPVLVMPAPATTIYSHPRERVLLDGKRDANPFFHLMEALWMLAGRRDATWLDRFVSDFSARFAEEDGNQHGAYGYRWRQYFDVEGGGLPALPDQLDTAVRLLRANPADRRVVITMWDPVADLDVVKKDVPCNTQIYLRVREQHQTVPGDGEVMLSAPMEKVLDITVTCRSNDAIWGAYGANAVHFSMLQEYLAARIGVGVGTYYQVSNNFHAYQDVLAKLGKLIVVTSSSYVAQKYLPLVDDPATFDDELKWFFQSTSVTPRQPKLDCKNKFLSQIAVPMFEAYGFWREKRREAALERLTGMPECDWYLAAKAFLQRRMDKLTAKETVGAS